LLRSLHPWCPVSSPFFLESTNFACFLVHPYLAACNHRPFFFSGLYCEAFPPPSVSLIPLRETFRSFFSIYSSPPRELGVLFFSRGFIKPGARSSEVSSFLPTATCGQRAKLFDHPRAARSPPGTLYSTCFLETLFFHDDIPPPLFLFWTSLGTALPLGPDIFFNGHPHLSDLLEWVDFAPSSFAVWPGPSKVGNLPRSPHTASLRTPHFHMMRLEFPALDSPPCFPAGSSEPPYLRG